MAKSKLLQASVRDFTGGLNLTDHPYNLSSKYQTVSDNVIVGPDGSLSPRMGYNLLKRMREGEIYAQEDPVSLTSFQFYSGQSEVLVTWAGHGMVGGWVLEFIDDCIVTVGGIPLNLKGAYTIALVSSSQFYIFPNYLAPANATVGPPVGGVGMTLRTGSWLPGTPLDMVFFQGNLLVFDDIGIIASVHVDTGAIARVWDAHKAALLGLFGGFHKAPWREGAKHISYATFKQTLLVVNGRNNDKPIEINFQRPSPLETKPVRYLADPATDSNLGVYSADYIQSFDDYVLLYGSLNTTMVAPNPSTITTVDISQKGVSGVFVGTLVGGAPGGAPDHGDAVTIDIGRASLTVEPRITAVSYIRNKVFVAFPDSSMLGTLGIYPTAGVHEPDFGDQVPQHGALNHRVVQNIGNDLFMCDSAGVPAFSQSIQSGTIVPERLSQLIYPVLNAHLARLSQETLRYKVWSLYSVRDRMYMLFVPKYDVASVKIADGEVIFVVTDFMADQEVILHVVRTGVDRPHGLSAGDYVTLSLEGAATLSCPGLANDKILGTRLVTAVIDDYSVMIKVGAVPTIDGAVGTSTGLTITPVDDETICYAYQYNPTMKIRRWTRLRGWYFLAGATTNDGRVYVIDREGVVFRLGTIDRPIYADKVGHAYETGDTGEEIYNGTIIYWAAETPWSDFSARTNVKVGEHVTFDVEGTGGFEFSLYVDNIVDDKATYMLSPSTGVSIARIPSLSGDDVGGFGAGAMAYGHGRRAKEQFNYHFPFRCKLARMRFNGEAREKLRICAVTLSYKKGSIYR